MAAAKKGLLAILAPDSEGEEGEESSRDELDAESRALKDFFAAGKRGDWAAAKSAFRDAYDACAMGHEEEGPALDTEE